MIFVDDKAVKVGGILLPGVMQSLDIKDDALVEEQAVEGSSVKAKQAQGYDDAKITIELLLIDGPASTAQQKLNIIQNLFKRAGQEKPIVHEIVNEHTAARRVNKVIFKSLGTKEDSQKKQLTASLEFWAYDTMTITATKTASSDSTVSSTSEYLDPAYQSYLKSSVNTASKTDNTPAVDDEDTAETKALLSALPY